MIKPSQRLYFALTCVLLLAVVACTPAPTVTLTPQRLPTRIPFTPTPTVTPTQPPITGRNYYREGLTRQEAGDEQGALQSFNWAIEQMPDFVPAYVARGGVYLAQNKLHLALVDANQAIEIDPGTVSAHALRGEVLRLMGRNQQALEAFDWAIELDPRIKPETFRSRWLAARAIADEIYMLALNREYAVAHPEDALRLYYRNWGFVELGQPRVAIRSLVNGIAAMPDPPALLWFTLGQAYMAIDSWAEAVIALENARTLVQVGDNSLVVHSDQPIAALFAALGRAYLGVGRCTDAEAMLEYAIDIGAPAAEHAPILEEARTCQTPTPTATPAPTITPG